MKPKGAKRKEVGDGRDDTDKPSSAAKPTKKKAKKQDKKRASRAVLKAVLAIVVLGALIAGALTFGRSRLFPSSWDPALTPLVDEVERLFRRSERYNRLVLSTATRFRQSVARYGAFLDACEARDGAAAERAVQASIRWAVDRVGPLLPTEADAP